MIEAIKNLFGIKPAVDFSELVKNGAIIIDVRSKGEYSGGHIKSSINVPLNVLNAQIDKLKSRNKVIITCCASGMRSASAKNILKSNNIDSYNGGAWQSLRAKIES